LHHATRNSHCAVSRSKAHLYRTANSFLFGTKVKIKIYSPQTLAEQEQVHTPDTLPDFVLQLGCQACVLRSSEQEPQA